METKKVVSILVFFFGGLVCLVMGFIGDSNRISKLVQPSIQGKIQRIDFCTRDFWRIVYIQEDSLSQEVLYKSINFPKQHNLSTSDSISKSENDEKVYFYKSKDGKFQLHCVYEIW
jgi:hypothetical protein